MSLKRGDDHEHEGGAERWLVSYADFITLMFAFFAVLYATSEKDVAKARELEESVKKYLIRGGGAGGAGDPGQHLKPAEKGNAVIEPPIPTYKDGRPDTIEMLDEAEAFVESKLTPEERKKFIRDLTADDWGVRIVIPATALYADKSEKFRADATDFAAKLAGLIRQTKRKVLIEGHVGQDETGSFRSTWDFASARAVNLLRFMQVKEKFAGSSLAAISLGDSRPASVSQLDLNPRIEVVLLNQDMEF